MLGSLPTIADAAPPSADLPLLWRGQVVDAHGNPTTATITGVLAPPTGLIPSGDQILAGAMALPPIPLVTSLAGRDGRFELRSALPAVPSAFMTSGWLNVMVFAESNDGGWAVATDSVRFVDAGRGAWASRLSSEVSRSLWMTPPASVLPSSSSNRRPVPPSSGAVNRDPRWVCGESGDPFKDTTRVIALTDTSGGPV